MMKSCYEESNSGSKMTSRHRNTVESIAVSFIHFIEGIIRFSIGRSQYLFFIQSLLFSTVACNKTLARPRER